MELSLVNDQDAGMMGDDGDSPRVSCGGMEPPALTTTINPATSASNSGISMNEDLVLYC
jgi:hypothetical protein